MWAIQLNSTLSANLRYPLVGWARQGRNGTERGGKGPINKCKSLFMTEVVGLEDPGLK